jgi:general secretion pathway protein H
MASRFATKIGAGHAAGFTLLELLIGLAIMGLALSVAPALLSKAVPGVEARGAAREMAAGLRAARGKAIASNRETALVLDVAGGAYKVEGEAKARRVPAGIGISLLTADELRIDATTARIAFFPDGGSSGGRVRLALAGRHYDVRVDWLTGRVTVVE